MKYNFSIYNLNDFSCKKCFCIPIQISSSKGPIPYKSALLRVKASRPSDDNQYIRL